MANTLLSNLFSSPMLKVENTTQGIAAIIPARCVRVNIRMRARPMHHMFEDGTTRVDAKILQPITIEIELIAPNKDIQMQLDNIMTDRDSLYSISSRGLLYKNMRLNFQSVDQSPDMLNAVPVRVQFQQLMFQGSGSVVYKAPADSSVIDKGLAMLKDTVSSTVSDVADKAKTMMGLI